MGIVMTGIVSATTRIGDRDRDAAVRHLGVALAAGYLGLAEYENRLETVFTAQTTADLGQVFADLPISRLRQQDPQRRQARRRAARRSVGIHAAAYLLMVVVVLVVWLSVAMSMGDWYFWPVWPILGAGIGLVAHAFSVRFALAAEAARL
jgi:disulfide bond formation protein DsbB